MKMWKTRMVNMGKTLYMIPISRILWYCPNMVSISIPTIIFDSTSIYANSQNVDLTLHALPHLRRAVCTRHHKVKCTLKNGTALD